jgi:C4-dicarboxylate transporter DctM subunit
VIPPSIPMIVYGSIAGVSIGALFVGGYVPGLIFGLGLALVIRWSALRHKIALDPPVALPSVFAAAKEAGPALLTPIIIMGGILGGIMTPTEAGAVAALYAFLVSYFIHREVTFSDLPRLLLNTAATTGIVMLVMTTAAVFSWIMAFESVPTDIADLFLNEVRQPWLFILILVAFLLVVGCFVDTISALIILTPVLVPVSGALQIDPLFLGVIVCIALTFGVLTPPVGVCLYVTSTIAKTTVEETTKFLAPFLVVLFTSLFILALFPNLILWLPRLVGF